MTRAKIFVDFWNLQLHWNSVVGRTPKGDPIRIPWDKGFITAVIGLLKSKRAEEVSYNGTHVYASVDPGGDAPLRKFLHVMDGFPGYAVSIKERKSVAGLLRGTPAQEDFHDVALARNRRRERRESLASVKRRLRKNGKLRAR